MKEKNSITNTEQNKKSDTKVGVRINKYLALKKISTRRGADELVKETSHLRSRYENPKARLFPVAVTYLIPRSLTKTASARFT